ncbi:unnamed protein product [Darwinula stevensoni]|uniref:Uncharacterized protein n=1 Tax=Darwinula stevensoni TaxID=69355 RepID=A0A7R9FPE0_9CRUS|nr:unnamed protein product [Darwinula stevensoni]CAG0897883.1 unnamed protein product [Darwinula stevensoni]
MVSMEPDLETSIAFVCLNKEKEKVLHAIGYDEVVNEGKNAGMKCLSEADVKSLVSMEPDLETSIAFVCLNKEKEQVLHAIGYDEVVNEGINAGMKCLSEADVKSIKISIEFLLDFLDEQKLKTWSLHRPLRRTQALTLPKSFRGQFYGKHVLVPMRTLAPYGYLVVSPNGTKTYEGLDGQVLRALSRKFNFVSEFLLIESGVEAVRNDLVAARTADFVISGSTIGTSKDIVYSNPYWIERLKFITTKPMEGSPWKRVFKPFNVMTWLLLVLVLVLTMIIFGWLSTLPCQVFGKIRVDSWYAFQIMVLQSRNRNRQPDDFGLQIALGSLILFAYLIFACIYSQTLTSYMAVPGYDPPVDSMQDIEDRELVCYNVVGVPIFDNLYDNNPKVKARLRYYSNDGRDPFWNLTPYRAMVKEPGKHCLATGRSVSSSAFNRFLMNAQGQIPFHVSAQNANMMLKVMILQRHCPYEEEFNDAILRLERAGLLRWWYDMELYLDFLSGLHDRRLGIKGPVEVPNTLNFDDIGRNVPRDHGAFAIQHLLGLFVILLVGYGLGLLVFLGEIAWHRSTLNHQG